MSAFGEITLNQLLQTAADHHQNGHLPEARALYLRILEQFPEQPVALHLLGVLAAQTGEPERGADLIGRAIAACPDEPDFHANLGMIQERLGRLAEATEAYRRAAELTPANAQFVFNYGNALRARKMMPEAIACYRQAVTLDPRHAGALNNLGNCLLGEGRPKEAVEYFRRVLQLSPDDFGACLNLANTLRKLNEHQESIACYQRAIEISGGAAVAFSALGNILKDCCQIDQAVIAYRRAVEAAPRDAGLHQDLVYAMQFDPAADARVIHEELRRWEERHAAPLRGEIPRHENDRSPDRRLRIGYVSPDFRDHVIGRNLLPLFRHHDRAAFEIVCYSSAAKADAITEEFRHLADRFVEARDWVDPQFANCIRADGIDILMDLTLHLEGSRWGVFARKPAPVQGTFAGYPGSTGLSTIDFRLTDPYLDPPGQDDSIYVEHSIRLPASFWCFDPWREVPPVGELPVLARGQVTFGSLNNFTKVNEATLRLWARVLGAVPESRLALLVSETTCRQRVLEILGHAGVGPERIVFFTKRPRLQYLELYQQIDVGLDTFPYNGHTTSLDSFFMGVPVVTLAGQRAVGRAGVSQCINLGLPELIAQSEEDFVRNAAGLARDTPRLANLRAGLRARMARSPLMDANQFARGVEQAYREMWRAWCTS